MAKVDSHKIHRDNVEVDYNNSLFESSQLKTRNFPTVQAVLDLLTNIQYKIFQ